MAITLKKPWLTGGLICLAVCLSGCATTPVVEMQTPPPTLVYPPQTTQINPGSIFQPGHERPLFEDRTARRIGDVLTILLEENTNASKSATTSTSKDESVSIDNPIVFGKEILRKGIPLFETTIGGERAFEGAGQSAQSNSLQGSITVQVVSRHANGNLLVEGEKWITLNQGQEVVRITGIIRPTDIAPDNTVPSTKVADARITYSGRGALADANAQGWAARFFNSPVWPF
ncbi:MAG: flagellar basal body L-ring protein FlgH [Pseudomonadota bacterium]|nr:flagellar basal body L-ring protein FlgH [Pseudomonadota bacterium]